MPEREGSSGAMAASETPIRMILGGLVVIVGVVAVVISLRLVLDHFELPEEGATGTEGEEATGVADSASAIVAVLAPLLAGIAAIVGLYFGITASASNKRQEAQAQVAQAATQEKALELAALADPAEAKKVIERARTEADEVP